MQEAGTTSLRAKVFIIGAGPAGLTASYLLTKKAQSVVIFEADPKYVGGISRTVDYKGYRFDIGGHRFFSKSKAVEDLWTELLGADMLDRPRSSRIYYRQKLFAYPLKAFEALFKLGPFEAVRCLASYFKFRLFPIQNPRNFEEWVTNHFGRRLFEIFFKTYTEKVWGMACTEISADWAAQRIKGMSLAAAIKNALFAPKPSTDRSKTIKSLIDSFRYPRKGPGMMWEAAANRTREQGGKLLMGVKVTGLTYNAQTKTWLAEGVDEKGTRYTCEAEHVISSAPLRDVVKGLTPRAQSIPDAEKLKYRDFITVALIMKERDLFDDNWIYIHDPNVKVGRIQNFKSWSPELVPEPGMCCYGLEYFCFEGDGLWTSADHDLIELATEEINRLGLARREDVVDGCVVRQAKAYPVYDDTYSQHVAVIRKEVDERYPNLHLVGRNGMHKYNNQDHAMMTAMLTAENILAGKSLYDVWGVNQDAEYHEAGSAGGEASTSGLRQVPKRI